MTSLITLQFECESEHSGATAEGVVVGVGVDAVEDGVVFFQCEPLSRLLDKIVAKVTKKGRKFQTSSPVFFRYTV